MIKKIKGKDLIYRADGRIEWKCEHGVGHTVFDPHCNSLIHGCCSKECCKDLEPFGTYIQRRVLGKKQK